MIVNEVLALYLHRYKLNYSFHIYWQAYISQYDSSVYYAKSILLNTNILLHLM